jgi:hypothetical protein
MEYAVEGRAAPLPLPDRWKMLFSPLFNVADLSLPLLVGGMESP